MKTLSLTTHDDHHIHLMKSGWEDVTVAELIDYQTRITKLTRVRQLIATAGWLSDVPADVLSSDVSIAAAIVNACAWLNTLPVAEGPLTCFTHAGTKYEHVGNLDVVKAGQLEALLDFLAAAENEPVAAIHQLLAVLYTRRAQEQTADSVTRAAEAFTALPVITAWPAIAFFLTSSASSALRTQQYSDAHAAAMKALTAASSLVAERLAASVIFSARWRWKGARLWTRCAQNLLATCSPSRTTAVTR